MALDLVWIWYLVTVTVTALVFGWNAPEGHVFAYAGIQLALLGALLVIRRTLAQSSPFAQRFARGALTLVGIPIVFSSMGLVLPAVHPEPWEWHWMAWDRALLEVDPTVALQAWLTPWFTELLQWIYASFYFIPMVAVAVVGWRRGRAAFDLGLLTVSFCFFASYLGYFLWPTLPPFLYLPHGGPLEGVWLTDALHRAIDDAELHRWNCFPSGHTMLSLVSLGVAWRVRPLFFCLLPVVLLLVFSTLALRYHYFVDVVAGAALVIPGLWVSRLLYTWCEGDPAVLTSPCSSLPPPAACRGTDRAGS